jgi:hypothetical protein
MTLARLTTNPDVEYEILRFTEDAEYVLRDAHGDVRILEEHSLVERVEVRCDYCGQWVQHAAPTAAPGTWRCHGGDGPWEGEAA